MVLGITPQLYVAGWMRDPDLSYPCSPHLKIGTGPECTEYADPDLHHSCLKITPSEDWDWTRVCQVCQMELLNLQHFCPPHLMTGIEPECARCAEWRS